MTGSLSDSIRSLHTAEPELTRAEISRRVGASRALVSQTLGSKQPTPHMGEPTMAATMDGAEFDACLRKMGVSRSWVARWLGVRPSWANKRAAGKVAIQPAEAVLFRMLAASTDALYQAVELSGVEGRDDVR